MTSLTVLPEAPVMYVIARVTINTGTRQTNLFHRLGMALGALKPLVFAG